MYITLIKKKMLNSLYFIIFTRSRKEIETIKLIHLICIWRYFRKISFVENRRFVRPTWSSSRGGNHRKFNLEKESEIQEMRLSRAKTRRPGETRGLTRDLGLKTRVGIYLQYSTPISLRLKRSSWANYTFQLIFFSFKRLYQF